MPGFDKNTDFVTRITGVALVGLLAFGAWRYLHPKTTFAADGTDPAWDSKVGRSKAEGKPGLVLFTAGWCGACRALHDQTLSNSDVANTINDRYTFSVVDLTNPTPADSRRAQQMGVSGIPALIRYDADGVETARTHFLPPAEMVKWLKDGG